METVGVAATAAGVLLLFAVTGLVFASIPDILRYRRLRRM